METMKDVLLKLHYLNLEINEIYTILQKIYKYGQIDTYIIKKVLNNYYDAYIKQDIIKIKDDLKKNHVMYVTILDGHYPKLLENIYMPPLVLFYKGQYELIGKRSIAVIGSRKYTDYGLKVCQKFVRELVKSNFTIISGLAYGIDSIAHDECIRQGGKTIAILGSGFNQIYPKKHEDLAQMIAKNHLLISEYPPNETAKKSHFPFRNRIVSGLSRGILVIEAKKRSGTLITCDYALDQGKDIFVIPNQIFDLNSEGCHQLIKQGAKLVTTINDILENFNE